MSPCALTAPAVLKYKITHFVRPILSCSDPSDRSKKNTQLWCMPWYFTHPHSQIYLLHLSLFSLCLSRSLCPPLSIHSVCMSVCFSLPASRWFCGGVNRDAIPALLLFTHTPWWFAHAPVWPGRKWEVSTVHTVFRCQSSISHLFAHLGVISCLQTPTSSSYHLYNSSSHPELWEIHPWSPKQLEVPSACPCVAEWRWALDGDGQMVNPNTGEPCGHVDILVESVT